MHDPIPPNDEIDDPLESPNTRVGLILFFAYTVVYASFVLVSAFRPTWMAKTIGGVNLAVLSGFGLIFGAIVLAAFYLWLCRPTAAKKSLHSSRRDA